MSASSLAARRNRLRKATSSAGSRGGWSGDRVPSAIVRSSVIRAAVGEWFETDYDVPFMLQVYQIREEKRPQVPAVTHVNGSGRLQSVTESQNARYYHLISAFRHLTGVPIVLNTSFNEN